MSAQSNPSPELGSTQPWRLPRSGSSQPPRLTHCSRTAMLAVRGVHVLTPASETSLLLCPLPGMPSTCPGTFFTRGWLFPRLQVAVQMSLPRVATVCVPPGPLSTHGPHACKHPPFFAWGVLSLLQNLLGPAMGWQSPKELPQPCDVYPTYRWPKCPIALAPRPPNRWVSLRLLFHEVSWKSPAVLSPSCPRCSSA